MDSFKMILFFIMICSAVSAFGSELVSSLNLNYGPNKISEIVGDVPRIKYFPDSSIPESPVEVSSQNNSNSKPKPTDSSSWTYLLPIENKNDHLSPQSIAKTGLKTRTFYKMRMKRFPLGTVTWTEKSSYNYNYVQIDNNQNHLPKYQEGWEWYNDSLWEFIPVLRNRENETGWYGLRNHGRKGAYLTWASDEWVNDHAYHVILDKRNSDKHKKSDFFLKPVKMSLEEEKGNGYAPQVKYYQIKLKNLPGDVVTWSGRKYGKDGSHFLQVDISRDWEHRKKYEKGNEWFEDTLFSFEKIDHEEEEDDSGELEWEQ